MDDVDDASAQVLKRLQDARIKPKQLVKCLGITPGGASRMLSGQRGIPQWHFAAIAKLLGVNLADLFAKNDLPRHKGDVGLAPRPSTEGSVHAADVRRMRAQFEGLFGEVQEVAVALYRVLDKYTAAASIDVQATVRKAGGPKPRGGGRR